MRQPSLLTASPDSLWPHGQPVLSSSPCPNPSHLCLGFAKSRNALTPRFLDLLALISRVLNQTCHPQKASLTSQNVGSPPPPPQPNRCRIGLELILSACLSVSSDSLRPRGLFQPLACLPSASYTCKFHERQDGLFWLSAMCPDPALRRPSGSVCRMNKHVHVSHTQVTRGTMGSSGMHGKFIIS